MSTTVSIYEMVDSWINSGTTYTSIKMHVTDTSSAAASKIMDLIVNSNSMFAVDKSGNLALAGNVDGRDIAADGTKLDTIESGATADQTGSEIKALYEVQTSAFTDAQFLKLSDVMWTFGNQSAMIASTNFSIGDLVMTQGDAASVDDRGTIWSIVAAGTHTTSSTVLNLTGISGQAVSTNSKLVDVIDLLADTRDYTIFSTNDIITTATEGFRYKVAASGATDHQLTTAGGVKLYVLRYNISPLEFGAVGDGVTDDRQAIIDMLAYTVLISANPPFKVDAKRTRPNQIEVIGYNYVYAISGQIDIVQENAGILFKDFTFKAIAGTWETAGAPTSVITGATQANPCVITSTAHGFSTKDSVEINNVAGMVELNGNTYAITVIDANNYSLDGINSTGFTAYTSAGDARSMFQSYRPQKSDYFFKCKANATYVKFTGCWFNCANLCGGVKLKYAGSVNSCRITECAGVGVEGAGGNTWIRDTFINQWNQSDVEYYDRDAYTGIGVLAPNSDVRIVDSWINWLRENIRFDGTNCHMWGGHSFNGCNGYLAADRSADAAFDLALEAYYGLPAGTAITHDFPERLHNTGVVLNGGVNADCSFNNVYFDNCHHELYSDRVVFRGTKLGHKVGATFGAMRNYWWKLYCHTNNATPASRISDTQIQVETGTKVKMIEFSSFGGNSWLVNYTWLEGTPVNAATSPDMDGLTFMHPMRHLLASGQGQPPAVTYVAPTSGAFIGFADNSTTADGSSYPLEARIGSVGDQLQLRVTNDVVVKSQDGTTERGRITDAGTYRFPALAVEPVGSNYEIAMSDGTASTNGFGATGAGIYQKLAGAWIKL